MQQFIDALLRTFGIYHGLPQPVYVLFFAQVVNSLGNFVLPFLTLLLTQKAGYSATAAGTIIMVASASFVPGSIIGGRLADHRGRKGVMLLGFLIAATGFTVCGLIDNMLLLPWFIIAAEFAMGLVEPTLQALVIDVTTPDNRQAAFSFLYLGHNIGFSVGPLVAGFLFNHNYRILFFGDAATTLIALTLVALFVHESLPSADEIHSIGSERPTEAAEDGSILRVMARRPLLLLFLFANLLATLVYSQYTFGLPLFMNDVFGERGPQFYGIVMTVNALTVVFLTAPVIGATRRLRPLTSVFASSLLFAVGFGVIVFGGTLWFFIATALIWTTGEILSATNVDVYIANHTPASHRGRMNALAPIIIGTGFATGPMLAGTFVDRFGSLWLWPATAALCLVTAALFLAIRALESRTDP